MAEWSAADISADVDIFTWLHTRLEETPRMITRSSRRLDQITGSQDRKMMLRSSTHQSRRELPVCDARVLRDRSKVHKKVICSCCDQSRDADKGASSCQKRKNIGDASHTKEKHMDKRSKTRGADTAATGCQKRKHIGGASHRKEKHMDKRIKTRDADSAASSCQKRKNIGDASHSKEKRRRLIANYTYADIPGSSETDTRRSEIVKPVTEVVNDGKSQRNREIIVCHNDSSSAIPTSCAVSVAPIPTRASTSSQPPSVLPHLEVRPQLRRRSASAPPRLQLAYSLKAAISTFVNLLQDVAAHESVNRVCNLLNDSYFDHMVAQISQMVPNCTCHSVTGCFMTSIHCMNILKARLSKKFNVNSQSSGDTVGTSAATVTQSHEDSNGRAQLEANVKGRASTKADVGGGTLPQPTSQCTTTPLMEKSKIMVSATETCMTTSCSTPFTEGTKDISQIDSSINIVLNQTSDRDFNEIVQLKKNIEESASITTHVTKGIVSEPTSGFGATLASISSRIMVSTTDTVSSTSSSLTGGNVPLDDNTGRARFKSNSMTGHVQQEKDPQIETFASSPDGEETDRDINMTENGADICEALDLSSHTGNEVHVEALGHQVQGVCDSNSTGKVVPAADVAKDEAINAPTIDSGVNSDAVNDARSNGSSGDDGDMDYGGNRNEDGAGEASPECDGSQGNDDDIADQNATGDEESDASDDSYVTPGRNPYAEQYARFFASGLYNAGLYGVGQPGQFTAPHFPAPQHTSPQHTAPQYTQHTAPQYTRHTAPQYTRHTAPQYTRHTAPQYTRHTAPQYTVPQFGVRQHTAPPAQFTAPQFPAPQHTAPQYTRHTAPQYTVPQFGVRQHTAPPAPQCDGGYAGPDFESVEDPDVMGVHAMVCTVRRGGPNDDRRLIIENEFRMFRNGVWRVIPAPDF